MQNLSVAESLTNTGMSHQGSPKDLAAEAGGESVSGGDCNWNDKTNNEEIINLEVMQQSLPVMNSKGRSCEGFSESSFSISEPSGSWGDFEGFEESLDKSERFSHGLEVLVKSTKPSGADTDLSSGRCSPSAAQFCAEPSLCTGILEALGFLNEIINSLDWGSVFRVVNRKNARAVWITAVAVFSLSIFLLITAGGGTTVQIWLRFFNIGWKKFGTNAKIEASSPRLFDRPTQCKYLLADHSCEDIFKLGFPEVFVSQSTENIRSLEQVLDTNNEDVGITELLKNQLCINSGNLWRTLRDSDNTPSLRHPWSKSHCQENLLSVLGIDANQKDISENQDDIFEESNVKDNEDFKFDGFSINNYKTLIQTKLSVSPDSRHGHLFTCSLFLKTTPSNENTQYITIPRKKHLFTTHNLKMKLFSSDVC